MSARYEVRVSDPFGNLLEVLTEFERLDLARKENDYGTLEVVLANEDAWPWDFWRVDMKLEVWRTPEGSSIGGLEGETVFFLRNWEFGCENNGARRVRLVGYDANYLWGGREIEYAAGSSQADKLNVPADDLMKAIVRENAGALATDTTRSLAGYLTVAADLGLAPVTSKSFARRKVLTVMQELAEESLQQGTYLAFDTVYTGASTLEFRTYVGQRGNNRGSTSGNALTISERSGTLQGGRLTEQHAGEINVVNAAGQGTGTERLVVQATNNALLNASPWARREKMLDCRNASLTATVTAEARAELFAERPRKVITGRLLENEGALYGRDFGFGDLVSVEHEGVTMDARINLVHVSVEAGVETLDIWVRGEA